MTICLAESLKQKVFDAFERGIPNGWILHWDENRFFDQISEIVRPYPLINYTTFDYAFCNRFEMDCRGDRKGTYLTFMCSY